MTRQHSILPYPNPNDSQPSFTQQQQVTGLQLVAVLQCTHNLSVALASTTALIETCHTQNYVTGNRN
jgi:hypothetical protein